MTDAIVTSGASKAYPPLETANINATRNRLRRRSSHKRLQRHVTRRHLNLSRSRKRACDNAASASRLRHGKRRRVQRRSLWAIEPRAAGASREFPSGQGQRQGPRAAAEGLVPNRSGPHRRAGSGARAGGWAVDWRRWRGWCWTCLLYTSDAADEEDSVDLGGRRIIKKKKT